MPNPGRRYLSLNAGLLGALLSACGNDAGGPLPIVCIEPRWEDIHAIVSSSACANSACHARDGLSRANGLDLSGSSLEVYARLVGVATGDSEGAGLFPLRVEAGSSTTSYFLHMLASPTPLGSELGQMPPGRPFPACDLEAVRAWIDAGAPER